ncbi:GATA zinc finger domain-containing protein 14-like [Polistes fuscatus]|uniref:GATA zinc finger domain-containing protein 14-like n=1 Tax=Polistes fuscatus TaxID=30207 RepID=UPI001CA8A652|nr:GATA zinc finger domain-containing protein 14-like [Polistes fuscatus]
MGTYKISMAIWLSLFLYLLGQSRISNATSSQINTKNVGNDDILLEEIVLSSKDNKTKFLGAAAIENPNNSANEQIMSLIKGTSDLVFPNFNSTQDQSLAQSQTVIVSLNDLKDLENLDHVLAFSEYESQKVDIKKDKRKSQDYFNNDQAIPNKQIKTVTETTVLPYVKTYYNVPRGFQSNSRNSYQDRYHPTTVSYQKVSQPFTQTEPSIIVANTEGSSKKLIIENLALPKLYKSENDLILGPIQVTKSTYYVPTRKIKNDESKMKNNVENNINIRPKLRKIKKKVKSLNIQTPTFVTTPMNVYNYTISNRLINKQHKSSLLDNPLVQPVASQRINNIIYQNDSLAIDNQPDLKRQKSLLDSKSNGEVNLLKKYYNVIPRPFSSSIKHAGNVVEQVLTTTINPVTSKNVIEIEESLIENNSKVNPTLNYSDKINHLDVKQEIGYKYRKESSTVKPRENYDNLESNIDDVSSSRINIINKKSINNDDNVEQFVNRPQRRNDEISESVTLKTYHPDSNNDTDYTESYKFPETSEKEQGYYDDYDDNKDVNHKQDLKRYKDDQNYETSNFENTDKDNNYDETKRDEDENHSDENSQEKNNLQGYDQDEDSSHNYKVEEKSNEDGSGGGGGGGEKKFAKGGEVEKKEDHYDKHGKMEEKGYKSLHEHDKGEKGHHDKVRHSKEYDEKNGEKKEHEENGKYHEDYYKDEEGKKEAKFNEKGEHKKGHSTKGEHSVHKKDEYEKKTEFFDEFHEDGDSEKDGKYYSEHEAEKGGKEKSGHYNEADDDGKHGKMKKYEKGEYYDENKGKDSKEGQDSHYDHEQKHMKKGAHESGKKWMMDSGDNEGGGGGSGGGGDKKDTGEDKHSR